MTVGRWGPGSVLVLSVALGTWTAARADMISAVDMGNVTPPTALSPASVINGDFTITEDDDEPTGSIVGDGKNESTFWLFDFTKDPGYATFDTSTPLASALLTLTLTPEDALVSTDSVHLGGLPGIATPAIQDLPVGVTSTITIQLLDYYSSAQILGRLVDNAGTPPRILRGRRDRELRESRPGHGPRAVLRGIAGPGRPGPRRPPPPVRLVSAPVVDAASWTLAT